jgi:hypothetical protein
MRSETSMTELDGKRVTWGLVAGSVQERRQVPDFGSEGLDGEPFFGYYDKDRTLSFIWSGDVTREVQVSYGGYGEPVFARFDFRSYKPKWVIAGTKTSAMAFQYACVNWIDFQETSW